MEVRKKLISILIDDFEGFETFSGEVTANVVEKTKLELEDAA